jgi:hypothetical protein
MHALGEEEDLITKEIIGKAIAIHRVLGPGLLESVYEYFLAHELRKGDLYDAKLLSYLRLANIERGLLINFHAYRLADGIKRLSLTRTG